MIEGSRWHYHIAAAPLGASAASVRSVLANLRTQFGTALPDGIVTYLSDLAERLERAPEDVARMLTAVESHGGLQTSYRRRVEDAVARVLSPNCSRGDCDDIVQLSGFHGQQIPGYDPKVQALLFRKDVAARVIGAGAADLLIGDTYVS